MNQSESMRVLVVFAHPNRESFMGKLVDRFAAGVQEAGHEVEIADLYAENFQPVIRTEDYAAFAGDQMPDDVQREQARVERADVVVLAYPIFWWSFPAILKGWFDRVFCQGWAWDSPDSPASILPSRRWIVLCSAGLSERAYLKYGYRDSFMNILTVGTLGYCGVSESEVRIFFEVDLEGDPELKESYLDQASEMGFRACEGVTKVAERRKNLTH